MWLHLETLMNMSHKILTILIGITSVLAVLLSACNKSSDNPLIGKWEHADISGEGEYAINSRLFFTFNSDGSGIAEFEANGKYIRPTSKQLKLTYSVSNDTLVIKYTESGQTMKNVIEQLDNTTMFVVGVGGEGQKLDFKKTGGI